MPIKIHKIKINLKIIFSGVFLIIFLYFLFSFFYTQYKYSLIKKLNPNVQISYFKKYLGEPVIINFSKNNQQKEYIFIDKHFYTQAITDKNDKVLGFFITLKDKNFNPQIKNQVFQITLGKSTLYDIAKNYQPEKCLGFLGNTARSYYFEEYYFGRIGKYLKYVFGYNDAGFYDEKNDLSFLIGKTKNTNNLCKNLKNKNTKNIIINTYGVLMDNNLEFEYAVDKNIVDFDF